MRECKNCTHGKSIRDGGVRCSVTGRFMIINRADDCEEYSDKYEVRKIKEKGRDI